jgi:hypothetical protein
MVQKLIFVVFFSAIAALLSSACGSDSDAKNSDASESPAAAANKSPSESPTAGNDDTDEPSAFDGTNDADEEQTDDSGDDSPPGDKLAFLSNEGGGPYRLWIANADGSERRLLTPNLEVDESWGIAVSKDGRQVAVIAREGDPWGMYSVDIRNGEMALLTGDFVNANRDPERIAARSVLVPSWTADGVLYLDSSSDEEPCVGVPAQGGKPEQEDPDDCVLGLAFASSPHSGEVVGLLLNSLVAFDPEQVSLQEADVVQPDLSIHENEDFRILAELFPKEDLDEAELGILALVGVQLTGGTRPVFSPDGEMIAIPFFGVVIIVPADGGETREVWRQEEGIDAAVATVIWSPDGGSLITGEIADNPTIRRIDIETGQAAVLLGGAYGAMAPTWVAD